MSDTFTRDLKLKCYEIAASSNYPQNGPDVIRMATSAFNWITGASDKNEQPNGKEAHITMNIGGVADANTFRHKKSTPDSSEGCSASKPKEPKDPEDEDKITVEFHALPLSHILHELLKNKSKQSKDPQFPHLLSDLPKEDREAIKKNMQDFVNSL